MDFWEQSGDWAGCGSTSLRARINWHGNINIDNCTIPIGLQIGNANSNNNNIGADMRLNDWECWSGVCPNGSGNHNSTNHVWWGAGTHHLNTGRGWNRSIKLTLHFGGVASVSGFWWDGWDTLTKMPDRPSLSWDGISKNSKTSATCRFRINNNHDFNFPGENMVRADQFGGGASGITPNGWGGNGDRRSRQYSGLTPNAVYWIKCYAHGDRYNWTSSGGQHEGGNVYRFDWRMWAHGEVSVQSITHADNTTFTAADVKFTFSNCIGHHWHMQIQFDDNSDFSSVNYSFDLGANTTTNGQKTQATGSMERGKRYYTRYRIWAYTSDSGFRDTWEWAGGWINGPTYQHGSKPTATLASYTGRDIKLDAVRITTTVSPTGEKPDNSRWQLRWSVAGKNTWTNVSYWTTMPNPSTHSVTGLAENTKYDLQVRGFTYDWGDWSGTYNYTTGWVVKNPGSISIQDADTNASDRNRLIVGVKYNLVAKWTSNADLGTPEDYNGTIASYCRLATQQSAPARYTDVSTNVRKTATVATEESKAQTYTGWQYTPVVADVGTNGLYFYIQDGNGSYRSDWGRDGIKVENQVKPNITAFVIAGTNPSDKINYPVTLSTRTRTTGNGNALSYTVKTYVDGALYQTDNDTGNNAPSTITLNTMSWGEHQIYMKWKLDSYYNNDLNTVHIGESNEYTSNTIKIEIGDKPSDGLVVAVDPASQPSGALRTFKWTISPAAWNLLQGRIYEYTITLNRTNGTKLVIANTTLVSTGTQITTSRIWQTADEGELVLSIRQKNSLGAASYVQKIAYLTTPEKPEHAKITWNSLPLGLNNWTIKYTITQGSDGDYDRSTSAMSVEIIDKTNKVVRTIQALKDEANNKTVWEFTNQQLLTYMDGTYKYRIKYIKRYTTGNTADYITDTFTQMIIPPEIEIEDETSIDISNPADPRLNIKVRPLYAISDKWFEWSEDYGTTWHRQTIDNDPFAWGTLTLHRKPLDEIYLRWHGTNPADEKTSKIVIYEIPTRYYTWLSYFLVGPEDRIRRWWVSNLTDKERKICNIRLNSN